MTTFYDAAGVPHIRSHQGKNRGSFALIDLLFSETQVDHLGASAILDRLADAMMFYVIRHSLAQGAQSAGLLVALADKQIGSALVAMCDEPAQAWTVDALAEKVFMSRSSFAERFNTLVGKTPMEFLAEWRMQLARRWLERDRLSVAEVPRAAVINRDRIQQGLQAHRRSRSRRVPARASTEINWQEFRV